MAVTCDATIIYDRDIFDIIERRYHRSIVDYMMPAGTADGQILYWDITISAWLNSDETKLKWDDVTDTLLVDTLNLNNALDISDYTNLIAGTNITFVGDTLNVDDAFLINNGDDTTTGTLTAGGFTTTGTATTDILIVGSNPPATASSAGVEGTITWDSDYIYGAVATNTWKRVAWSTWGISAENVIYAGEDVVYAAEQVVYP